MALTISLKFGASGFRGLKGRVTIPQFSSTFAFITPAETDRLLGGSPNGSFDKAFAKLKELKPNIASFVGPAGQYIQLSAEGDLADSEPVPELMTLARCGG